MRILHRSTLALLVLALTTIGWVPQQGTFSESFNGSGGRRAAAGVHPSGGQVRWDVAAPDGFVGDANGAAATSSMMLDRNDHVLVAVRRDAPTVQYELKAYNTADGSLAWTAGADLMNGVSPGCTAVDAASGAIWTIAAADTFDRFLMQIDPTSGAEVAGSRIPVPAECDNGLHLLPGNLIAFQDRCCEDSILTYDTATGVAGVRYPAVGDPSDIVDGFMLTSPAGDRIYVLEDNDGVGPDLRLVSIDVGTGARIGDVDLAGNVGRFRAALQAYVDVDGGIVVETEEAAEDAWISRVIDDGAGLLAVDWVVQAFERDGFAGTGTDDFLSAPSALQPGGVDGQLVVAKQSNLADGFVALNLDDGTLAWTAPVDSGTVQDEDWLVDAAGNVIAVYEIGRRIEGTTRVPYDVFAAGTGTLLGSGPQNLVQGIAGVVLDDDGTLYLVGSRDGGDAMVAVEAGTPGVFPPGVSRLDAGEGAAPREIATTVCQTLFPEPDTARAVLLAREDVFADALAGAPLAGSDACILFTPRDMLDPTVRAEIDRVLPDGGTIQILGGSAAVVPDIESELTTAGYAVERFGGGSRFETARIIANRVREITPGSTVSMLAFAGNWPDAITGGAYAAYAGVPILLTDTATMHPDAAAGLSELGTTRTLVMGGTAVIAQAVADAAPGPERISGTTRMATAVAAATDLWLPAITTLDTFVIVNLQRADAWNLALAAAPLSARFSAPQLGVSADAYPMETRDFLVAKGFKTLPAAVLIGDLSYIGAAVEDGVATTLEG